MLTLDGDGVQKIVGQPGPDNGPQWSPDGRQIVFTSAMGRERFFAHNPRLAIVPADGGTPRSISDSFDEVPSIVEWTPAGIYFTALQRTASHLFRLDPASGAFTRFSAPDDLMAGSFTLSSDGRRVAFTAGSPRSLPEVFVSDMDSFAPQALTDLSAQAASFVLGTRELISLEEQGRRDDRGRADQAGRLRSGQTYPLLCIIHGGPTGIDRPTLLAPDTRYYPSDIWAARGALILKVNYRGSAGYGEQFRHAQRAQPRRRRCLGRDLRRRSPHRQGLGRSARRSPAWDGARAATSPRF